MLLKFCPFPSEDWKTNTACLLLLQPLPGMKVPKLSPLATLSSKILWNLVFQTGCEFSGPHRHQEGGVSAWLAQTQGETSPPAFMGLMEMAERTRAEQVLKQRCFIPYSWGAMVWDELLASSGSLEAKPTGPLPGTLMHQLQGAYLTVRRKGRLVFARKTPRVCITHTCPCAEPQVQAQALI